VNSVRTKLLEIIYEQSGPNERHPVMLLSRLATIVRHPSA